MSAGGPGSRSKASTVGRFGALASESEGCSSIAASCAIQTRVGRPSQTQKSILPACGPASTRAVLHPFRPVLGAALLEEGRVEVLDAFGEAAQGHRPAAQVGDHRRRHLGVVVDHLALGEAGLRVEDLVEVGELQLTPLDLDLAVRGHRLLGGLRLGLGFCASPWLAALSSRRWPGAFFAAVSRARLAPALDRGDALLQGRHQVGRLGRLALLARRASTISLPSALRSISASSCSRYSSR